MHTQHKSHLNFVLRGGGGVNFKRAQDCFQENPALWHWNISVIWTWGQRLWRMCYRTKLRATLLPEPFTTEHIWADEEEQTNWILFFFCCFGLIMSEKFCSSEDKAKWYKNKTKQNKRTRYYFKYVITYSLAFSFVTLVITYFVILNSWQTLSAVG